MVRRHAIALAASFVLLALAGCALGAREPASDERVAQSGRIELPKPEPFPGPAGGDAPPPAWLVVGGEAVQGSYGIFCDQDICADGILFGGSAADVATVEVPAGGGALVAVGTGRIEEFDAGWEGWDYEGDETTMGPGSFAEAGGARSGMRALDAQRKPDPQKPVVEPPAAGRGGLTVFELRSTGGPGERLLYVTVRVQDERAAKTPGRDRRLPFDWASYRWHLEPD